MVVASILVVALVVFWNPEPSTPLRPAPPILETLQKFPPEYHEQILGHFFPKAVARSSSSSETKPEPDAQSTHYVVRPVRPAVNLRAGPGANYKIIGKAELTDTFEVETFANDWIQIRPLGAHVLNDGITRGPENSPWVRSDLVVEEKESRFAPVISGQ